MSEEFQDAMYREISYDKNKAKSNIVPAEESIISGSAKISIEEDSHDGVKIILKKDENENIKEIKFVCSCGETKSVILDYNDE